MKTFEYDFENNPSFESITGLNNTTYDNSNIRSGQMATEDQIRQLWIDANNLEQRIDYCCRDIVVWKSYVRVIAENTNIVVSDWLDNVAVGTTRRGIPFTVEFALPHDSSKFFDDRSTNGNYIYSFGISVNFPGKATEAEEKFINSAIGCPYNNTTNNNECKYEVTNTGYWLRDSNNNTLTGGLINSLRTSPKPLPQYNNGIATSGFITPIDTYYMYKDSTDNKIKIDVKRRDQFRNDEYLALFWIQFVLRNGATL